MRSTFVSLCAFVALTPFCTAGELPGQQLLMTLVRTGDTEIFLANPETGDLTNLTRSPRSEERYPCWSPDGRQIGFISDRDGTPNLYAMNADGTHVRRLTRTRSVCYMPSWSGERIVFGMHGDKPEMASISPVKVPNVPLRWLPA